MTDSKQKLNQLIKDNTPVSKQKTNVANVKNSITNSMGFESERISSISSNKNERVHSKASTTKDLSLNSVSTLNKPGSEVLTLIATWIKNAPNDFLGYFLLSPNFYIKKITTEIDTII